VLLKDTPQSIDIVLVDAGTGNESGFVLARWIREHFPGLRVILAGTIVRATEKAGDLCQDGPALSKPYDHRLVLSRIQQLLAGRKRGG
jgi:DNA-binding response OmpR family regulator